MVTEFNTGEVDGRGGRLISYDGREVPFDLPVLVPLDGGQAYVDCSPGLGDEFGFVPTNQHTLQSNAKPNVFVVGDAADVPASKAGSSPTSSARPWPGTSAGTWPVSRIHHHFQRLARGHLSRPDHGQRLTHKMDQLDIPSIPEFIEMIADTGAGLYGCNASADLFGLTKEALIDQAKGIITVGEFYDLAGGGQIIFT